MSKTDTNIVIRDLKPNVYYNLLFKYTYYDDNNVLRDYIFDSVGTKTVVPKITMSVLKIVDSKIYYKLSFDKNYTVTGGTIDLLADGIYTEISASIPTFGNVSSLSGDNCYLDISNLTFAPGDNRLLSLKVSSLSFNTYTVVPGVSYSFRY